MRKGTSRTHTDTYWKVLRGEDWKREEGRRGKRIEGMKKKGLKEE